MKLYVRWRSIDDKKLELRKIGNCSLIWDTNSPNSIYYNRIKGFSFTHFLFLAKKDTSLMIL
jgi:hypothetical protein